MEEQKKEKLTPAEKEAKTKRLLSFLLVILVAVFIGVGLMWFVHGALGLVFIFLSFLGLGRTA